MNKAERNGKIDFYKFIMSLIVIIYHFGNAVDYDGEWFRKGYIAVEFFFIVSGFLFAKSLSKYSNTENKRIVSSSLSFMGRKYTGFLPYHFFICIATFVVLIIYHKWNITDIIAGLPDLLLIGMGGVHHISEIGHEWYLSAMLIVMFILTPIMIKYRDAYSRYIAPAAVLLIFGYIFNEYNSLDVVYSWNGIVYSGLLRAFAEISLGIICFAVYESKFVERFNKIPLFFVEVLSYAALLIYAFGCYDSSLEFSIVLIAAVGITISFSNKTSVRFLNNKFVYFLGKLSFPIYLNQIYIRYLIVKIDWEYGYLSHLGIYVLAVIVSSLVCIVMMDGFTKIINKLLKKKNKY